jgi:hypothetical protein
VTPAIGFAPRGPRIDSGAAARLADGDRRTEIIGAMLPPRVRRQPSGHTALEHDSEKWKPFSEKIMLHQKVGAPIDSI